MKPTDEMCRMLDELGIKYNVLDQDGLETVTYFDLPDGREVGYTEFSSGNTQLRIWNETPEQAIAATVGRCDYTYDEWVEINNAVGDAMEYALGCKEEE